MNSDIYEPACNVSRDKIQSGRLIQAVDHLIQPYKVHPYTGTGSVQEPVNSFLTTALEGGEGQRHATGAENIAPTGIRSPDHPVAISTTLHSPLDTIV